jgi:predicted nuclease with RNAse H fold
VLTLGVDLAAADERTAMATVEWRGGRAVVRELVRGVEDARIVAAVEGVDKAGIDCPLGWPDAFVSFVAEHQRGRVVAPVARRELAYRVTDLVLRERPGPNPLSVSADLIAHVAFRCAGILGRLGEVDRAGDGVVVEVYPAAALHRWGLPHSGYKKVGGSLVDQLVAAAPWLELGDHEGLCRSSHDAFDAVVAALVARAAAVGRTLGPDARQRAAARTEGWIAVPTCDLDALS